MQDAVVLKLAKISVPLLGGVVVDFVGEVEGC